MANIGGGSVHPVIATATNTPGTAIPVGTHPTGIAITQNGATAYVATYGNTVVPIDTATNTAGTPIAVGNSSFGIAITPNGATVYVTLRLSDTVVPINTATNTAGTPIGVGTNPFGIAITPNGATAYVANYGSNTVTPIATATNTAGTAIKVGSGPAAIAITPDGATAYVIGRRHNTVTPIDTATNTAGNPISVGTGPVGVAITPDEAPVANLSVTAKPRRKTSRFDASTSTVTYGSIATYAWKFGDGTKSTTTKPTTTHVYAKAGTYKVSVTETSSGGTSTAVVFTGQTVGNNGAKTARAKATIVIP